MADAEASIGELLVRWRAGEAGARDALVAAILPELRQVAAARLRREGATSLSVGDLINDAMLRLMRHDPDGLVDQAHVVALASRIMRNILIDHARGKRTDKRHHHRVELNTRVDGEQRVDLEALDFALIRLGAIEPRLMELVEMRYFGGMSIEEVATATGQSAATVKRRWRTARAWLTDALNAPALHG